MESNADPLPDGIRSNEVVGFVDDDEVAAPPPMVPESRRRSLMELPAELQSEIFVRMPVKLISLCKCVCKTFRNLIPNPSFVQTHLSRNITNSSSENSQSLVLQFDRFYDGKYEHVLLSVDTTTKDVVSSFNLTPSIPPPIPDANLRSVNLVGSCNGLILFGVSFKSLSDCRVQDVLLLWNPAIKQSKCLPKPHYDYDGPVEFGFIPQSNDYAVLKFACKHKVIEVYKLSIDSWVIVDCNMFADTLPLHRDQTPVFINGSFHWFAVGIECILYYNLEHEKLGVIEMIDDDRALNIADLSDPDARSYIKKKLAVVDKSLAIIYWSFDRYTFEIWVMNDYGVEDSWSLQFQVVETLPHYLIRGMVGYWANGLMIIDEGVKGERAEGDYLGNNSDELTTYVLYDIITRSRIRIPRMEHGGRITEFCSFVETLVPVR